MFFSGKIIGHVMPYIMNKDIINNIVIRKSK